MYDKTIANDFRIYEITIPDSPSLLINLLSASDRNDYESIVSGSGLVTTRPLEGRPRQQYVRTVVDGYVVSTISGFYIAHKVDGAYEFNDKNLQYTNPVYFWPEKTWIKTDSPIPGIIRIFFS
jgi:hypothetical protein